jgi:hypothetical protein
MSFEVVHTCALPGVDHGDELLKSLNARFSREYSLQKMRLLATQAALMG